jgi:hypothetical protein
MISIPDVVDKERVSSAEFVKLTVENTNTSVTYTFSTAYKTETISSVEYAALGGLLAIGQQQRDLRVTSFDTTIALAGVDPENIFIVLGNQIRGSSIEISRGFYNDNGILGSVYNRFKGIVTSYNITETREGQDDSFNIVINCSSYKTVLENNVGGRKTNQDDWKFLYGNTDTSMDNVSNLAGAYFDFGLPVTGGSGGTTVNPDTAPATVTEQP